MTSVIEKVFANSWKNYKKSWKNIFIISATFIIAIALVTLLSISIFGINTIRIYYNNIISSTSSNTQWNAMKDMLTNLGGFFALLITLIIVVNAYFTSFMSSLAAKPKQSLSKIFHMGNKKYLNLLGAEILITLIMSLAIFIAAILIVGSAFVPILFPIVTVLLIIGLIFIKLKLTFVFPEIYMKNKNASDSIKYSWKETRKSILTIFAVFVIIAFISFVFVAFPPWIYSIINIFFLWPFTILCMFELYRQVKK